jgi:predicted PurR-regulated permease PerM
MDALFDWTPAQYVESLLGILADVDSTLGAYIRGQMIEGACVGAVTAAGLALFGFDGALLFGIATGAMNLVPMMAPIVGGALALLFGYFQGLSTSALIGIFFLFLLVRLLDDFVFIPFVLGHSVALHPVMILFAVLAGFEIGGFVGLVVAVPLTAVLKVVLGAIFGERRLTPVLDGRHIAS